jgi:hypothetical protein
MAVEPHAKIASNRTTPRTALSNLDGYTLRWPPRFERVRVDLNGERSPGQKIQMGSVVDKCGLSRGRSDAQAAMQLSLNASTAAGAGAVASRDLPLKLAVTPFCQGLPGSISAASMPWATIWGLLSLGDKVRRS